MKIVVLIFGGDVFGMNVVICVIVCVGIVEGYEMFGIMDGYRGFLEDCFIFLFVKDVLGMLSIGGIKFGIVRVFEFKEILV